MGVPPLPMAAPPALSAETVPPEMVTAPPSPLLIIMPGNRGVKDGATFADSGLGAAAADGRAPGADGGNRAAVDGNGTAAAAGKGYA